MIDNNYDALGKRVSKEVVNFDEPQKSYSRFYYYDGENVLFETDKDKNIVAAYLHGSSIDDPLAMVRREKTKLEE